MSSDGHVLAVRNLTKEFPLQRSVRETVTRQGQVHRAVDDVSFSLTRGEILGLAGGSGSGKTTLARCIIRLVEPDSGEIELDGVDVRAAHRRELRELRRRMQMVFQDPFAALNPKMRIRDIVAEPFAIHAAGTMKVAPAHGLRTHGARPFFLCQALLNVASLAFRLPVFCKVVRIL